MENKNKLLINLPDGYELITTGDNTYTVVEKKKQKQLPKTWEDLTITEQELFLWQRFYFNRDVGDLSRMTYWEKRIEELNKEKGLKQNEKN
jgi:hypothetical protein